MSCSRPNALNGRKGTCMVRMGGLVRILRKLDFRAVVLVPISA